MKLSRGAVVLLNLSPTFGHEQQGHRPAVVVSDQAVISHQRFPMIAVVPITSVPAEGPLYPRIPAGDGGLRKDSFALVDQVRAVDKRRVRKVFGELSLSVIDAVDDGLRLFFGLGL